jgi:hypothetical protein
MPLAVGVVRELLALLLLLLDMAEMVALELQAQFQELLQLTLAAVLDTAQQEERQQVAQVVVVQVRLVQLIQVVVGVEPPLVQMDTTAVAVSSSFVIQTHSEQRPLSRKTQPIPTQ